MASTPSGIVTFLFTDIEDSTRLWEDHSQLMRVMLARHDVILRDAIAGRGGTVFSTGGDGFVAAFQDADDGLAAAIAAQGALIAETWPSGVELRVRMGLHTGDAEQREGDFFGPHVNRAARISATANGRQIVVSDTTANALHELGGIELVDKGQCRLKGVAAPIRIFGVVAAGVDLSDEPLRISGTALGNLPAQLPSFVARETEAKLLTEAVVTHRLVTVTGVGGVGKTRLALHVAADLVPMFPDGTWFVELAAVIDGKSVGHALAATLNIAQRGLSAEQSVIEALESRRMLIVLDNCEHVLSDVAALVDRLLAKTTAVSVLATSREALSCAGEQIWPLVPLAHAGTDSAAAQLFVERARSAVPDFEPEQYQDVIAQVCDRLDGLPLAIELAAARVRSLSPRQLLDRLSDRFRLLTRDRAGSSRHQTLAETVRWSFDLLTEPERGVLCRLAVFAGGFSLEAAVASYDLVVPADVYGILDSLVRKSLVTTDPSGSEMRFGVLETIREFGEEELARSDALVASRDRHAQYFAALCEHHLEQFCTLNQAESFAWFATELANVRAALQWSMSRDDLDTAIAITASSGFVHYWRENYEPVAWAEDLLPSARARAHRRLPSLLSSAANCAWLGRVDDGGVYADEAIRCLEDATFEPDRFAWEHVARAVVHFFEGSVDLFTDTLAVGMVRPEDSRLLANRGWYFWGLGACGRDEEARTIAADVVREAESTGIPWTIIAAMHGVGRAFADVDPDRSLAAYRRGVNLARSSGNRWWYAITGSEMGALEARAGEPGDALDCFAEILPFVWEAGDTIGLHRVFAWLVGVFDRLDHPETAATLLGKVAMYLDSSAPDIDVERSRQRLRADLRPERFDELAATGAAMSVAAAVDFAQDEILTAQRRLAHAGHSSHS